MCLMDVTPPPLPVPATLLYYNDQQDLIMHLIKASAVHNEIVWPLNLAIWGKILKSAKGRCPLCFFSTLCLFLWRPWIFSCYWSVLLPGFQNPLRSMPRLQGLLVISSRFPCVDFSLLPIAFSSKWYSPTWSTCNFSRAVKRSLRLEFSALLALFHGRWWKCIRCRSHSVWIKKILSHSWPQAPYSDAFIPKFLEKDTSDI